MGKEKKGSKPAAFIHGLIVTPNLPAPSVPQAPHKTSSSLQRRGNYHSSTTSQTFAF